MSGKPAKYPERPGKTYWPDPKQHAIFRSVALRRGENATTDAADEAERLYIEKYNHVL